MGQERGDQGRRYGAGDEYRGRASASYGRDPRYDDSGFAYGEPRDNRAHRQDARDDDDRGFFDRAGDEVRSWFGDEDAEQRRARDARETDYWRGGEDRNFRGGGTGYGAPRGQRHDPAYREWRQRQIDALDRDYEDYRREHQSKFDNDFGGWRTQRQSQRGMIAQVQEHAEVTGSDGEHVGAVDHVKGDRLLLTKSDKDAGGHHHSVPCSWVQSVEDGKVMLTKTADQARTAWKDEERSGFFGRGRDTDPRDGHYGDGPHVLGRSFSGTY